MLAESSHCLAVHDDLRVSLGSASVAVGVSFALACSSATLG